MIFTHNFLLYSICYEEASGIVVLVLSFLRFFSDNVPASAQVLPTIDHHLSVHSHLSSFIDILFHIFFQSTLFLQQNLQLFSLRPHWSFLVTYSCLLIPLSFILTILFLFLVFSPDLSRLLVPECFDGCFLYMILVVLVDFNYSSLLIHFILMTVFRLKLMYWALFFFINELWYFSYSIYFLLIPRFFSVTDFLFSLETLFLLSANPFSFPSHQKLHFFFPFPSPPSLPLSSYRPF